MEKKITFTDNGSVLDPQDFPLSENQPDTIEKIYEEYHIFSFLYSTCF